MRVLHVGAGNLFGGIETMLATMARHRGSCPELDQAFAVCVEGRLSGELRAEGAPVHVLGPARASRPWTVWRVRRAMLRLLRAERFDAVLAHGAWAHAVFGRAVRRSQAAPILWQHAPVELDHWLERWAGRCPPDLIIANSHFTQHTVPKLFGKTPVRVVYCPVSAPSWEYKAQRDATRAELETPAECVAILMAARMESWKGHRLLLKALSELKNVVDWECWIAGGAQRPEEVRYLAEIRSLAAPWGVESRVRFLGQRSDVPRLMAAADIYCQPNEKPEPFGIVFVEALLAGLPVVAVRSGGAIEIVDATCGVLTAEGDAAGLAAALCELIDNPVRRRQLGAAGPERAKQLCDPASRLSQLHTILTSDLIKEHARSVGRDR